MGRQHGPKMPEGHCGEYVREERQYEGARRREEGKKRR